MAKAAVEAVATATVALAGAAEGSVVAVVVEPTMVASAPTSARAT